MRCPVCEAENPAGAPECELCGRVLGPPSRLEPATFEMPELERTLVAAPALRVDVEPLEVSRTALEAPAPGTPSFWEGTAPEIEPSRADGGGERTPAPPDDGVCPFCGAYGVDAVCDNCGRRKKVYGAAAAPGGLSAEAGGDPVLCPACFSRVARGPRCVECGVPFPPSLHVE